MFCYDKTTCPVGNCLGHTWAIGDTTAVVFPSNYGRAQWKYSWERGNVPLHRPSECCWPSSGTWVPKPLSKLRSWRPWRKMKKDRWKKWGRKNMKKRHGGHWTRLKLATWSSAHIRNQDRQDNVQCKWYLALVCRLAILDSQRQGDLVVQKQEECRILQHELQSDSKCAVNCCGRPCQRYSPLFVGILETRSGTSCDSGAARAESPGRHRAWFACGGSSLSHRHTAEHCKWDSSVRANHQQEKPHNPWWTRDSSNHLLHRVVPSNRCHKRMTLSQQRSGPTLMVHGHDDMQRFGRNPQRWWSGWFHLRRDWRNNDLWRLQLGL